MWSGIQLTQYCSGVPPYLERLNPTPMGSDCLSSLAMSCCAGHCVSGRLQYILVYLFRRRKSGVSLRSACEFNRHEDSMCFLYLHDYHEKYFSPPHPARISGYIGVCRDSTSALLATPGRVFGPPHFVTSIMRRYTILYVVCGRCIVRHRIFMGYYEG